MSDEDWIVVVADVHHRTNFPQMDLEDLTAASRSVLAALRRGKSGTDAVDGLLGQLLEESFRQLAKKKMIDKLPLKKYREV